MLSGATCEALDEYRGFRHVVCYVYAQSIKFVRKRTGQECPVYRFSDVIVYTLDSSVILYTPLLYSIPDRRDIPVPPRLHEICQDDIKLDFRT